MRVLAYILILFFASSCKKAKDRKCFKSLGPIVTEIRTVSSFEKIVFNDHIDLKIKEDSVQWIEVKTGDNLANLINTEVNDGELAISDDNKCNFLRDLSHKPVVTVHTPNIKEIEISGSGNLDIKHYNLSSLSINSVQANGEYNIDIDCDSLALNILGTPLINLKGTADYMYFYHFGSGNFVANDLTNQESLINWNSTGNLYINSIISLTGQIFSSGNVYYHGNPVVNITTYSSGRLIKED